MGRKLVSPFLILTTGQSCSELTIAGHLGPSRASRTRWELRPPTARPSPLRSSKPFLLIPHGSVCTLVATVPNLRAIKPPRPLEAVPGGHCPPLLHHLRLQCNCISGWPGLSSTREEGRGRVRLGIHTMPKRWVPAQVYHTISLLTSLHTPPSPQSLPAFRTEALILCS